MRWGRAVRLNRIACGVALVLLATACGMRLPKDVAARLRDAALRGQSGSQSQVGAGSASGGAGSGDLTAGAAAANGSGPLASGNAGGGPAAASNAPGGASGGPAAGAGVSAAQCASWGTGAPGVTAKQINLATMVTDSGPLPGATAGDYRGTAAYLAMVNAQGGICGRQLVTQEGDDGLDPSKGRADFERLQPNVFAFVGNLAAADSGYIDLIRSTAVPYVSSTVDPAGHDIPNAYPKIKTGMVSDAPFVWWRQQHPKAVNAAVLYTAVNGVTTNLPPTVAAIKHAGFNVVYENGLSPTSPDYTPQVLSMRGKNIDMVYLFALEVNMHARLIRDMRQQGFQPAIQGVQLSYDTEYQRLLGSEGDGWEDPITYAPHLDPSEAANNAGLAAFDTWTSRLFPSAKNDFFAVQGWWLTDYFVKALKSINGPLTRQALIQALGAIHAVDGMGMVPSNDPTTGLPTNCFVMAKSQGGAWKREAPAGNGFICNVGQVFQS